MLLDCRILRLVSWWRIMHINKPIWHILISFNIGSIIYFFLEFMFLTALYAIINLLHLTLKHAKTSKKYKFQSMSWLVCWSVAVQLRVELFEHYECNLLVSSSLPAPASMEPVVSHIWAMRSWLMNVCIISMNDSR